MARVYPRIIHIPLSGGRPQGAGQRGVVRRTGHESYYVESVLTRSAAEANVREAERLECDAWNAFMWAGGPEMPSPGAQADPTRCGH